MSFRVVGFWFQFPMDKWHRFANQIPLVQYHFTIKPSVMVQCELFAFWGRQKSTNYVMDMNGATWFASLVLLQASPLSPPSTPIVNTIYLLVYVVFIAFGSQSIKTNRAHKIFKYSVNNSIHASHPPVFKNAKLYTAKLSIAEHNLDQGLLAFKTFYGLINSVE